MDTIDKLYQKGVSRRNFLVGAGAAGAVTALAGCGDNGVFTAPPLASLTDTDILTFALNLEYLEAEFYLYAATGSGLAATDQGSGAGATTVQANAKVPGLNVAQTNIINEIAYDEQTHVQFLRKNLTNPVSKPAIDLTFFGPLAVAAGITTAASGAGSYSPFASFDAFLVGAFIFEDVGVTAYNGAAAAFSGIGQNNPLLGAAAGILAVEAYHAAYVRTILTANAIKQFVPSAKAGTPPTTTYAPFNQAIQVQMLRQKLTVGGSVDKGEKLLALPADITSGTGFTTVVNADSNALAYTRTSDQVHHIVYGDPTIGVGKGGFFPNGTNYKFSVTTS